MSFQTKYRDGQNIDMNTKQKIINQLKEDVDLLKAKYLLDEKSRSEKNSNNNYINQRQSDEFAKTLPKKNEINNIDYNLGTFPNENYEDYNELNFVDKNNFLEKNESLLMSDNKYSDDENINNNIKEIYPREYKKNNLNLNDLQFTKEKNDNYKDVNFKKDDIENYLNNQEKNSNHRKLIDYDMFDKAKENLLKVKSDLNELDKYDMKKNNKLYNIQRNQDNLENKDNDESLMEEEKPKNFDEEISIHSKSIREESNINIINNNDKNNINNYDYNPSNGSYHLRNNDQDNIGYNHENLKYSNNPYKYSNRGQNKDIYPENNYDYMQNNLKSFNSKNNQRLKTDENNSGISKDYYSQGDSYDQNDIRQQNYYSRSPESLLRFNNSDSQSPDRNNQKNYQENKENNNPYLKKMKGKYDPKYKREKSKEKFEKLKDEMKQKFQMEHTFKPRINYTFSSNEKKFEPRSDIYKRLSTPKILEINKRQKEKENNDFLKMKDECTFQPNKNRINQDFDEISERSVKPDKITTRLYKLAEQMKEKREKLKRDQQENEIGNYSFAPNIDDYSKKLVMKYEKKPIHERYNEILTAKNQNLYLLRLNNEKMEKNLHTPEININSKKIVQHNLNKSVVDLTTHERLYKEGVKKLRERQDENFNDLDECTFSPQLCYSTTQPGGNIDDFLERQKIYDEIKKDRLDRKMSKSIENKLYTFKPKINITSEFLVKTDTNRINENQHEKYDRLSTQNYERILKKKIELEENYYSQYNYKPKINEVSKYLGRENSVNELANRKPSGKSKDYRSNIVKEQIQECTFNPKTNRNKFENIKSNYKNDDNILYRINDELKSKTEKVDGLKNFIDERDQKECKFKPEINKEIPKYENKEPLVMKGFARHVEQMEKARKAKRDQQEREKEVFTTGENWSRDNLITVPKPFNLSYQKLGQSKKKDEVIKRNKDEELKNCTFKPATNES